MPPKEKTILRDWSIHTTPTTGVAHVGHFPTWNFKEDIDFPNMSCLLHPIIKKCVDLLLDVYVHFTQSSLHIFVVVTMEPTAASIVDVPFSSTRANHPVLGSLRVILDRDLYRLPSLLGP